MYMYIDTDREASDKEPSGGEMKWNRAEILVLKGDSGREHQMSYCQLSYVGSIDCSSHLLPHCP